MKIHTYESYDEYRQIQIEGNKRKINVVWVKAEDIKFICEKISLPSGAWILCHGVRNAAELRYFSRYDPSVHVIGTEISETAHQYSGVVCWDFHEETPDWFGRFNLVYSNAWDHSYDPKKSLSAWKGQLAPQGHLVIEWSPAHNTVTTLDPFGATEEEYEDIFEALELNVVHKEPRGSRILYFLEA